MQSSKPLIYVTWDGPSTNYLEALFAPILARLDRPVHVVQATTADAEMRASTERRLQALGLAYHPVELRPGLGLFTGLARGRWRLGRLVNILPDATVMVRSVLAGLLLTGLSHRPLVFDSDGLLADERVEFAGWRDRGLPYRILRGLEAELLRSAQAILARTERGRKVLLARAGPGVDPRSVFVVTNGRDTEQYRPAEDRISVRQRLGLPREAPIAIHCGSVGPQYLPDAMVRLHRSVLHRRPDARLVFLTGSIGAAQAAIGDTPGVVVKRVPAHEVPGYLSAADVGLALRMPSFSQAAVCPIKVAEYLLCGLPTILSAGVGDLDAQVSSVEGVHILPEPSLDALESAALWILEHAIPDRTNLSRSCLVAGLRHFRLEDAVHALETALNYAEAA